MKGRAIIATVATALFLALILTGRQAVDKFSLCALTVLVWSLVLANLAAERQIRQLKRELAANSGRRYEPEPASGEVVD